MLEGAHMTLHVLIPAIAAWAVYKKEWKRPWRIMLATMAVDLDHLLAVPVFDPARCSIGFHPLHSCLAISLYCFLFFIRKLRLVSAGLLIHMALDWTDCLI